MTQPVTLTSPHEVARYRTRIEENLEKSRQMLAALCTNADGASLFQQLKLEKTVIDLVGPARAFVGSHKPESNLSDFPIRPDRCFGICRQ